MALLGLALPTTALAHSGHPDDGIWSQLLSLEHTIANAVSLLVLIGFTIFAIIHKKKPAKKILDKSDKLK